MTGTIGNIFAASSICGLVLLLSSPAFSQSGAKTYTGTWTQDTNSSGSMTLVVRSGGDATLEFGSTSCGGQRPIPANELDVKDDRIAIVGDGKFELNIGGMCGSANVTVSSQGDTLKFYFKRRDGITFEGEVRP